MTDQAITVRPNVQQVAVTPNAQKVTATFGPPGPPGPQGTQGPTGPAGPAGPAGTTDYTQLANKPGAIVANVKDHGAIGDGTTDDRAALAAAVATGRPVYVPPGTYNLTKGASSYAIGLPAGTRLHGPGTLRLANSAPIATSVISVNGPNVHIDGVTIDGNSANQTVETQQQRHGIVVAGQQTAHITNTHITGCAGDAILLNTGTKNVVIANNTIDNCARNGVTLYGNTAGAVVNEDIVIQANHIEAYAQPVDSEPVGGYCRNVRIIGNYLQSTGSDYALTLTGSGDGNVSDGWVVHGNTLMGAIHVYYSRRAKITNNHVDATTLPHEALYCLKYADDILVAGNTLLSPANKDGAYVASSAGVQIGSVTFADNIITTSGTGRGIYCEGVKQLIATGNTVRNTGGAAATTGGVHVFATFPVDFASIQANLIEGFGRGITVTPYQANTFKGVTLIGNQIHDPNGTPAAETGIFLATGVAAQYGQVVVNGNSVGSTYPTRENLQDVLVVIGGGGDRPVYSGRGNPESVVTANIGALYLRRDGAANLTLYIKQATGNTGWAAK